MKKIIIVLLAMLFVVSSVFSFVSCEKSPYESPYDYLTDSERQIYLSIKNKLSDFIDPSSVKITKAIEGKKGLAYIEITAKNGFGGMAKSEFVVLLEDYTFSITPAAKLKKGDIRELSDLLSLLKTRVSVQEQLDFVADVYATESIYNVSALNSALDEYKKENGWD